MSADSAAIEARAMGTTSLAGRNALEIGVVRSLSKRSDAQGLLRFGIHLGCIVLGGVLVWLARPHWGLMIPAMIFEGFCLASMFAPMHECVHRTAFASNRLNEIAGWVAGLLSFYNFTYYRHYHTWHHRYTQDLDKDPELSDAKPQSVAGYMLEISGLMFWLRRPLMFTRMTLGCAVQDPWVPANARWKIAVSAGAQLFVYVAGLASIALGSPQAGLYFFLPVVLGQPLLRAILITEHTGCSHDEDGLTNTRTTTTVFPIRLLMWNMPFHTEHHLYPSIPFFQLPSAHRELKVKLKHLAPGYVAANRAVIESFQQAGRGEALLTGVTAESPVHTESRPAGTQPLQPR